MTLFSETTDSDRSSQLGNGPLSEWGWRIITAAVGALLAYGAVTSDVSRLTEREKNHYEEVLRRLDTISIDIRTLTERPERAR